MTVEDESQDFRIYDRLTSHWKRDLRLQNLKFRHRVIFVAK